MTFDSEASNLSKSIKLTFLTVVSKVIKNTNLIGAVRMSKWDVKYPYIYRGI